METLTQEEKPKQQILSWQQRNREKYNAYKRKYYAEHKVALRKAARNHYRTHRDACIKSTREWQKKNRDKWNAYQGKWKQNHPEDNCRRVIEWREKNRDRYNAYHREYYRRRKLEKQENGAAKRD
jgi:hypothetical protein